MQHHRFLKYWLEFFFFFTKIRKIGLLEINEFCIKLLHVSLQIASWQTFIVNLNFGYLLYTITNFHYWRNLSTISGTFSSVRNREIAIIQCYRVFFIFLYKRGKRNVVQYLWQFLHWRLYRQILSSWDRLF